MKRSAGAFACGVVFATLGGLIGMGGAEFRLPALTGWFKFSVRQAVPLNLFVSLIAVIASFVARGVLIGFAPVAQFVPEIASLAIAALPVHGSPRDCLRR